MIRLALEAARLVLTIGCWAVLLGVLMVVFNA